MATQASATPSLPPSVVSTLRAAPPRLIVLVQPNHNQKRRYNSDGPTRGQIKDDSGERVPTVRLDNYRRHCMIYMMACTSNGEPHPFFELQSVDKCGCKASTLDGRPAVITETSPDKDMEARFAACLKRLAMRTVQEASEYDFTKWKCESEKVHLGFLAVALPSHEPLASCLSNAIHMVQGRLLEMKRIIPGTGSCDGENVICITGKNFPASSNLKVRFFLQPPGAVDKMWESYGDVDNSDSSEKHLVVTVPRGPSLCRDRDQVQVAVEILPGTTTQTRQKGKHLYYSYVSPSAGAPSHIANSLEAMRNTLADVRKSGQNVLVGIEPPSYGGEIRRQLDQASSQATTTFTGSSTDTVGAGTPFPGFPRQPVVWQSIPPPMSRSSHENPNQFQMQGLEEASVDPIARVPQMFGGSSGFRRPAAHVPGIKPDPGVGRKRPSSEGVNDAPSKLQPLHSGTALHGQMPLRNGMVSMSNGSVPGLQHAQIAPNAVSQGMALNHDPDASASTVDMMSSSMFSPDQFSTVGQPSPGGSSLPNLPGMEGYGNTLSPMVTGLDSQMSSEVSVPGDLVLNAGNYTDENFQMYVNSVEQQVPGPGVGQ